MTKLHLHVEEHIATLTIDSPPANALSSTLIQQIEAKLTEIEQDETVKAVILKGEGRFFSAGADIKEFTSLQEASGYETVSRDGQIVFDRIEQFHIPVIAAIHGAALGGGLELALSCHMRIVTEETKIGLPELTLGIIPGFAGTQRLPKLIGQPKAYEMMLTSDPISGKEAYQFGLANHVVKEEELQSFTNNIAKKIVAKSKPTINAVMELVSYGALHGADAGAKEEAKAFAKVFGNEDAKEGIQAFLEKRQPNFSDK